MNKHGQKQQAQVRIQTKEIQKLPDDMETEIKDAFTYFDNEKKGTINRSQLRSILGNFAFSNMNVKEIEDQLKKDSQNKQNFTFEECIKIISKKWFQGGGKEQEGEEFFKLFDRKGRNGISLQDVKHLFGQYLDINISDNDIFEFLQEADTDGDQVLDKNDFYRKFGYN
ncbi:hypothetical protein IMG5_131350 [Ichthyophthirius multifiliis]|uniref:EF-hand domain-containing protein n=1 Tax=Ichthyophthirius multifiliis TaxID=5932 RepID=G0QWE4_ICHMU|nr:hypothetical protein IMG5_131350 [Ichthyophthirius multifiliis]EGR30461.1 hypothetical protein IMG5_131350 [Ichthyophthirius multifiliis]|eukprot:XP_004032048.1 hypothetical protein IMG5_131350 [Ichthyophthirius multifiliis]